MGMAVGPNRRKKASLLFVIPLYHTHSWCAGRIVYFLKAVAWVGTLRIKVKKWMWFWFYHDYSLPMHPYFWLMRVSNNGTNSAPLTIPLIHDSRVWLSMTKHIIPVYVWECNCWLFVSRPFETKRLATHSRIVILCMVGTLAKRIIVFPCGCF